MSDYDKVAKYYFSRRDDKTRFDFNRDLEVPAMLEMIGDSNGKRVLDLGCGFGDHLVKLSKQKPEKLIGVDLSSELIEIAKRQNIANCELKVGDISEKLNFADNSFDLVFSSLVIHYLSPEELSNMFLEVNRILKSGGEFLFSTDHPTFALRKESVGNMVENLVLDKGMLINSTYFNEGPHVVDLGSGLGVHNVYNFTFETLIKTSLESGFEIVDYKDIKPVDSVKDFDKYKYCVTMPTFVIFKLKKK